MHVIDASGKKIEQLPKKGVYILSIPYTYDPEASFNRSVRAVKWLRDVQKVAVFSPILHTHPYHVACKKAQPSHDDDYYTWDIALYDAMKGNATMIFTGDHASSRGCTIEMEWAKKKGIPILFLEE